MAVLMESGGTEHLSPSSPLLEKEVQRLDVRVREALILVCNIHTIGFLQEVW